MVAGTLREGWNSEEWRAVGAITETPPIHWHPPQSPQRQAETSSTSEQPDHPELGGYTKRSRSGAGAHSPGSNPGECSTLKDRLRPLG